MSSVVQFARNIGDSLTHLVANLGTSRDKSASSSYVLTLLGDADHLPAA